MAAIDPQILLDEAKCYACYSNSSLADMLKLALLSRIAQSSGGTASGITAGTYSGLTVNENGIASAGTNRSFVSNAVRAIVAVAAAANGWQISATRDAEVKYSVTITTAVQIGVVTTVEGTVVLEVAAINSAVAGDWQEVGRSTASQDVSLAVAFANTEKHSSQVTGYVPAGFFVRLRSINTSGTPTFAYNSGQEAIL